MTGEELSALITGCVAAVTAVLGAYGGYVIRPRVDRRNGNSNTNNSGREIRDEHRETRHQMHSRFDRNADKLDIGLDRLIERTENGFKELSGKIQGGFTDVVRELRELQRIQKNS